MNTHLHAPAELYLGSSIAAALEQGPRAFRSAALAIRFAMEHAAPVSLRGAKLRTVDGTLSSDQIREIYSSSDYPFDRTGFGKPRR